MKRPTILISLSTVNAPVFEGVIGDTDILYTDRATAAAVRKAGGRPVYLPSFSLTQEEIAEYLEGVDGVLITGADTSTNPKHYGEEPTHIKGRIDDERDETDLALIRAAHARGLPVLGLCKGMQLINVAFGGTLYQNVDVQHQNTVTHDVRGKRTESTHHVRLVEGSHLQTCVGATDFEVNGGHTQAVKTLPSGLKAVAIADDGIIEAIEGTNGIYLLGTQFHAELRGDEAGRKIFEQFIEACLPA